MPQKRLLLPFKSVAGDQPVGHMPHNPFVVCINMEKDGEENILHLRMSGCEQDVMGAAKECLLGNNVMSVATFGRSRQVTLI